MARRKISIGEALQVLRDNNLEVVTKPISNIVEPEEPVSTAQHKGVIQRIGTTAVKISLYSQHCVGCGEHTSTYGPGVVTVPTTIASQLLHQDQLARQADARMLDRTERSFLVMQRIGADGAMVNVGVPVNNDLMDGFGGDLSKMTTMII